MFEPKEIIFCPSDSCNLKCPHCFVKREKNELNAQIAKKFLQSAVPFVEKVGFSGGEPFLRPEFLFEIAKETVKLDLLFDQIITNGAWWNTTEQLKTTLQTLFDAGYDGKIALSWDAFHAQNPASIEIFVNEVQKIFGENSIIVQSVKGEGRSLSPSRRFAASIPLSAGEASPATPPLKSSFKISQKKFKKNHPEIPFYYLPQTFQASDKRAWKNFFWFKEDFCEGPGQILFVHANGKIAPCCGFANENEELFVGKITEPFATILKNASENKMVKLCYETGLSSLRKKIQKTNKKFLPGIASDPCSFCDFVCKNKIALENLLK